MNSTTEAEIFSQCKQYDPVENMIQPINIPSEAEIFAQCKQLVPGCENMDQPTTSDGWDEVYWCVLSAQKTDPTSKDLGHPLRKFEYMCWYFAHRYGDPNTERRYGYRFTRMRYTADHLFDQFEREPSKTNMTTLLSFYKTAKIWNIQLHSLVGSIPLLLWIRGEIRNYEEREHLFYELIHRVTARFVDICIGLNGLNLDPYTVIFITDHLAEVNKLTMFQRLKIIDSVRRFHLSPMR